MEFEKNQKYFTEKNKAIVFGVPAVIAIVGLVLMIAVSGMRVPGLLLIIAAFIVLVAFLTTGLKDSDIDDVCATQTNTLEAHASEHFKFPRRYEQLHSNVVLGGYDFTRTEETPVKRGKDLKYRNGFYCGVLLNFTNDGLRIDSRKFSILSDDMKEELLHFKWEEVEGAKLVEKDVNVTTIRGENVTLKAEVLEIALKNGKTYSYCVRNTADVDEAIDIIYRQTVRVKQEELKVKAEAEAAAQA